MATKAELVNQNTELRNQLTNRDTAYARTTRRANVATGVAVVAALGLAFAGGVVVDGALKPAAIVTTGEMPSLTPSPLVTEMPGTPRPSEAAGTPSSEKIGSLDISSIGKDTWSRDIANWGPIKDANGNIIGAVMTPEPHGLNSVVSTTEFNVGQAYWDAKVSGEHQAIGLVVAPGQTVPVRGISEYPVLPGQTPEDATAQAFDGQVNLEHETQPNVCTLEITQSLQAIAGNEQTVAVDQWEAQKLSTKQAAQRFGRDAWSQNPANWEIVDGGFGVKLKVNPNGSNSIVEMTDAVGQVYWDAMVDGEHQAIAGTLGVGVIAPVRGVTVYTGVPVGMEQGALDNAFNKAVNLEIKTQPGVYVVKISKADCPPATQTAQVVAPEATKPTVRPTAKPEVKPTATPDWRIPFEKAEGLTSRAQLLADGGLKIVNGAPVTVTIDKNEQIQYWDGTKVVKLNGPASVLVNEATVYKIK